MHYASYRAALRSRFGRPVVKVPVNGGFSCPNRDGTKSTQGCFFCDNRSFSPAAFSGNRTAAEQLESIITRSAGKKRLYLPYLQPFTNTYGTVEELRQVYEPLLDVEGVIGLAVGTRPDCFTEEIHRYLADLAKRTYLSIELGLQSTHDNTLRQCNRGHTFREFVAANERLASDGVEVVAHMMLGLPGETPAMMNESAMRLADLPCRGVKLHQLMIIKDTPFEKWYHAGRCPVLSIEEYCEFLCSFLSFLRPDQQIHRLVADSTVENGLVAPMWSTEKMKALQAIHAYMDRHEFSQGENRRRGGESFGCDTGRL